MQQSQNVKLKLNSSECISSNFDKYQDMVQSRTEQYQARGYKTFFSCSTQLSMKIQTHIKGLLCVLSEFLLF